MARKKELHVPPQLQNKLTSLQAKRLSKVSGIAEAEIANLKIDEVFNKFEFELDRTLLFFRKVCGQVVKTDPDSGISYPVPFATVHVEDTDCHLLSFAPLESPYMWFFPFHCHREEIATVVTDACGHFCVYIPRWEIDWILKWRHERICFPDILVRPDIRDIFEEVFPRFPPWPEPDPEPWLVRYDGAALDRLRDRLGNKTVERIGQLYEAASFGQSSHELEQLLSSPAFRKSLPPPLPEAISRGVKTSGKFSEFASLHKETLGNLAADVRTNTDATKLLNAVRMDRYIGPFRRCFDIFIPEWSTILDVPDITFRVTQDVDGDGDEELIYSEGLFDVRWNSGDIPDVTLEANENAISTTICNPPSDIPCEEPAIVMAGLMPLHNPPADPIPYHDQDSGYAKRPNRPHPTGGFATPSIPMPPPAELLATAPFTGTVQLYGCNQHSGAHFYRLRYKFNGGSPQNFNHHSWKLFRWVGSPGHLEVMTVVPDANGWYEIINPADQWLPSHLLLNWPTKGYQNGLYDVYMELANNGKAVIHTTPEIGIRVDNTWGGNNEAGATAHFSVLKWRHVGEGDADWRSLLVSCPVIRRNAGVAVEIAVGIEVATPHLRSIILWGSGCGSTHPSITSSLPTNWEAYAGSRGMRHWHTSAVDNHFDNSVNPLIYQLAASAEPGVYSFNLRAHSRAFNPDGGDGGFEADWHYNPVENYRYPHIDIAVVDI